MPKRFDPTKLFERWRYRPDPRVSVYPDVESSLDAVQARKKGMAFFSSVVSSLASPGSEMAEWLQLAFERKLLVVLEVDAVPKWKLERQPVHVFLSQPEELWRVPAFIGLWKTAFADGRWSDGAENLMSYLLGYTEQQRKAWLKMHREDKPAWTCATVYALLSKNQKKLVESLGRRCFGPTETLEEIALFFHRGDVLKRDAHALVPEDQTLARVGLRWKEFHLLFGKFDSMKKRGLISKLVPKEMAPAISSAFLSNIQFLTRSGWR